MGMLQGDAVGVADAEGVADAAGVADAEGVAVLDVHVDVDGVWGSYQSRFSLLAHTHHRYVNMLSSSYIYSVLVTAPYIPRWYGARWSYFLLFYNFCIGYLYRMIKMNRKENN
jgi:hypothetical protein